MADNIDDQIRACSEAYERAVWRTQLDDADRYWHELCILRRRKALIELGYDIAPEMPDRIVATR